MNDEIEKINKALYKLESISNNVSSTRKEMKEALEKLEGIDFIFDDFRQILIDSKQAIESLNREREELELEKKRKEEKISQLTDEQRKILNQYHEIEAQLKKFQSLVVQFDNREFKFEDVKAMLGIFSVLLEEIFQGQPHARILYTLHGEKNEMTRDELKNTTGISGAMVLRAVHELARVGLVSYDEDTRKVILLKRIY
ncbi:MAG: hypothetical protein ACTSWN_05125 [Promethearchaeota archaeon]